MLHWPELHDLRLGVALGCVCICRHASAPYWHVAVDASDAAMCLEFLTGKAAWNGGKEVALFVGNQLYTAATVAQPHVESLASSAAGALQSAAESTMDSIRGQTRFLQRPDLRVLLLTFLICNPMP